MHTTSRSSATGVGFRVASESDPQPDAPWDVHTSFLLWLVVIAAGVGETVLHLVDSLLLDPSSGTGGEAVTTGLMANLAVRLAVYSVLVYVITQMRLGKSWARVVLAVLLGGFGMLSLMIGPARWLAGNNSPDELLAGADLLFIFVASVRVLHLASVITALVFMFRPASNNYFRTAVRQLPHTVRYPPTQLPSSGKLVVAPTAQTFPDDG